jgi:hypothetical protein
MSPYLHCCCRLEYLLELRPLLSSPGSAHLEIDERFVRLEKGELWLPRSGALSVCRFCSQKNRASSL